MGEQLERYVDLVRSSPHNLLSARGLAELPTRHVPEALAFAAMLPRGVQRLLDIGSGGGLPGMVVAIARQDLDVHLLDATRKKSTFLRQTAAALDVRVTVHNGRAEDLAASHLAEAFDVVTARAVAALPILVSFAAPYLGSRGQIYAIKGERWRDELDAAAAVLRTHGLQVLATPDDQHEPGPNDPKVIVLGRAT
ncbi:MAG: 16S rRNA (guanine(527)-N(7))-methyltransferase RsmG [Nitriliruptoraceae bacterium]